MSSNIFWTYVDTHRYIKGGVNKLTHTTLGAPRGSFSFEGADHEEFMKMYNEVLKDGKYPLYFVERPNPITYLFFDIDFNHRQKTRQYKNEHIIKLIRLVNECLQENFLVTDKHLQAFITEKPGPTYKPNEELYKDGPHIYYPFLPLSAKQRYYIMNMVREKCNTCDIFENIPFVNKMSDVFDSSIIESNGILMYGSSKENCQPYTLTYIYDSNLNSKNIEEYDQEELVYTLSNRRYDEESEIKNTDNVQYKIDEIYTQKIAKEKTIEEKPCEKKNKLEIEFIESNNSETLAKKKDIELAKKLVHILSNERASKYSDWIVVGFALHGVSESLFDTFVEFSKRCMSKFLENKVPCEKIWKCEPSTDGNRYGMGTLRHLARIDNPDKYFAVIKEVNEKLFGKIASGKHVDIASVIYEIYKDKFVCVDIDKRIWYEFKDHLWEMIPSAHSLMKLISDDVRKELLHYCGELMVQLKHDDPDYDTKSGSTKKLQQTAERLGDVPFRENILKACAPMFYDKNFLDNLDSNRMLIGCNNGVYDLTQHCFRNGLPSDMVSKSVQYDYKIYTGREEVFKVMNKFFCEIQTEDDMREYMLLFMASLLRGHPDSYFHMINGGGGNGKSALMDLIKNMMGDYYGVLPVTVLTAKRKSSSNATPELADKHGKRFLVIQEPEHNDVIFVGQMKELTGKDRLHVRNLYEKASTYEPQFKLALTCNILPHIPSTDRGTWRRLRVMPFESEFVTSNPVGPKQFLINEELTEEFKKWSQPLLWLLLTKYYPIYEKGVGGKKFTIAEPAKVIKYTSDYRADSDVYMEFIRTQLKITNDSNDSEHIEHLYDAFKNWYTHAYSEKPRPKKNLIEYFAKNGYKTDDTHVYGIRFSFVIQ